MAKGKIPLFLVRVESLFTINVLVAFCHWLAVHRVCSRRYSDAMFRKDFLAQHEHWSWGRFMEEIWAIFDRCIYAKNVNRIEEEARRFARFFCEEKNGYIHLSALSMLITFKEADTYMIGVSDLPEFLARAICNELGFIRWRSYPVEVDAAGHWYVTNVTKPMAAKSVSYCIRRARKTLSNVDAKFMAGMSNNVHDLPWMKKCGEKIFFNPDNKLIFHYGGLKDSSESGIEFVMGNGPYFAHYFGDGNGIAEMEVFNDSGIPGKKSK